MGFGPVKAFIQPRTKEIEIRLKKTHLPVKLGA
jgi:hypothetical protein